MCGFVNCIIEQAIGSVNSDWILVKVVRIEPTQYPILMRVMPSLYVHCHRRGRRRQEQPPGVQAVLSADHRVCGTQSCGPAHNEGLRPSRRQACSRTLAQLNDLLPGYRGSSWRRFCDCAFVGFMRSLSSLSFSSTTWITTLFFPTVMLFLSRNGRVCWLCVAT